MSAKKGESLAIGERIIISHGISFDGGTTKMLNSITIINYNNCGLLCTKNEGQSDNGGEAHLKRDLQNVFTPKQPPPGSRAGSCQHQKVSNQLKSFFLQHHLQHSCRSGGPRCHRRRRRRHLGSRIRQQRGDFCAD